ncbi:hypothetical protein [Geobacter sp. DSM 9736]|uniref:hypothetical protein n=1 Tax=Geobacter sp. DSM 9736 TaxID=1277350 RepID=UPI000B512F35|nr:hypothetical protein [Geobacter sp. DSM 9736]SNB47175.1 PEP-CTERM protein-sorting domain-containing protein [Geobacter sp. DSM 9736]
MDLTTITQGDAPISGGSTTAMDDRPLNYYPDQAVDIDQELRQVNRESVLERALEMITAPSSVLLLSAGIGLVLRRRIGLGSVLLAGFLLRNALVTKNPPRSLLRRLGMREKDELDVERYALKAQRGDYGKLEVIPFR